MRRFIFLSCVIFIIFFTGCYAGESASDRSRTRMSSEPERETRRWDDDYSFDLPEVPDPPPPLPPLPEIDLPTRNESPSQRSVAQTAQPRPESTRFSGPFRNTARVRAHIFGRPNVQGNLFRGQRRTSSGRVYYHQGIDVLARKGTPIIAPADGVIERAGAWNPGGYGRAVIVRVDTTEGTYYALYAHLDSVAVKGGQRVRRGEVIGAVGNSGNAGGLPEAEMHLHLEVRNREPVGRGLEGRLDPLDFFPGIAKP